MARFTIPRDIYYGRGSIEVLKTLHGTKAVIVTCGESMLRHGHLQNVTGCLQQAGISCHIIDNVQPDPCVDAVISGAETMRRHSPDLIVALGGGSAIDAAKAMWVFYEHPKVSFSQLITPFGFPRLRSLARFIAIPSTSGTGSEVSAFSVITDDSSGIKYPLADFEITPDIAIIDPDIAESMPPALAAYTGMDALTHAIEAYVSTLHSPFSDPLALYAISMIFAELPASYNGDARAREQMHYAQCLAGMAFTNALLGISHSLAHKTGAAFSDGHIAHGCANAIYLPYVIEFNAHDSDALRRYAQIGRFTGLGGTDDAVTAALCDKLRYYNSLFGIPANLRAYGIKEREFTAKLPELARLAAEDACTGSNPRSVSVEDMKRLLLRIYYG